MTTLTPPAGYSWGIARRSRHNPRPLPHLIGPDVQMVCTGGLGLHSGVRIDKRCPTCVRWLREWHDEEG
jgi:hypothetical protein